MARASALCRTGGRWRGALVAAALGVLGTLVAPVARAEALSGTLTVVGSDTLSTLVLRWSDAFRARHPGVSIQLQTPGSASAPIALLEGAADIGAMSRPMSADEAAQFRQRFGYAPTGIVVAHDAIVVFVHPDNPLTAITKRQLDAIYSDTLRCGAAAPITRWDALGGAGNAAGATRILATGRNSASGTSEFFREQALCGGEYRAGRRRLAGPRRDRGGRRRQPRGDRLRRDRLSQRPGQAARVSRLGTMRRPWRPSWRMS